MKLIREYIDYKDIEVLTEALTSGSTDEPTIRLKGPMLGANQKNRNGRIYPTGLIEREVKKYNDEKISKGTNRGELSHPESPEINLDRVSHIIEELYMDGDIGYGVAKLIDTPMGRIAKTLVKEKQCLGMSSRGVGSLKENIVQEDYLLCTIDLVDSPSFDKAMKEAVLENKEYIIKDDIIVEVAIKNLKKKVAKKFNPKSMSGDVLNYMLEFVAEIGKKPL